MADERPAFRHTPERRGLIGPFSGRQLLFAFGAVIVAIVGLTIATTPLGNTAGGPAFEDPQATPFIIGEAVEGLHVGDLAPDFDIALPDGTTYQLHDVDGNPVRLSDLRGKAVWVNFFATWCPPCQGETPVLREVAEKYKDQGLEVVGVSVQETTADDVRAYRDRFDLDYTVGFDGSGHVFHEYRVYALPTQFFIDPDGAIRYRRPGATERRGRVAAGRGDPAGRDGHSLSVRLVAEAVPVADQASNRVVASWDSTTIQSSSAAWANSDALTMTESSGKSSNEVTQRGFAAHGRMHRSPKNASGRLPGARTTMAWWPVECPPVGRRTPRKQLLLALGPALGAPVAHQPQVRLDVARDEPRVVAERDLPFGALGHDAALGKAREPSDRSRPPAWSKWRWLIATTSTDSGSKPAVPSAATIHGPS